MRKLILSFILLCVVCAVGVVRSQGLSSKLKEDYFKEMASRDSVDPEIRIIWYDSLLNVTNGDNIEIMLKKIKLLGDAGYSDKAFSLSDDLLKGNKKLPLHHKLPLLYSRATSMHDSRNMLSALAEYTNLLDIPKPDSLKYWNVKTGLSMFTIYNDLGDRVKAEEWLKKTEAMIASYPLTNDFRRDAEGRCHGSRATLLIEDNKLDSAYKEVRLARELGTSSQAQMASLIQTAQIYITKGQTEAARQYLEQAMKIKINGQIKRTAIYMLAWCYLQEKRYDDALRVLFSYPQQSIKVNSMGNTRAYYILRGQACAGEGYLAMAYNSLDSALVVGDSIMAKMAKIQRINAEKYIQTQREAENATKSAKYLMGWVMALCLCILVLAAAVLPLLLRNFRLRKLLRQQRLQVKQARIDTHNSQVIETKSKETEDNMNRRQTGLLLRLAHLDSALDGLKKKLAEGELDKKERDAILRQLQEISGKEKMWELFSMQFEVTNRKFLDLLSERHPTLTKSEKRICAFMLINLSTKEIASLLERSPRTVDVTKYNIRKKLGIEMPTEEYLRQLAEEANTIKFNRSAADLTVSSGNSGDSDAGKDSVK